jgi:hypothetical protein
MGPAFNFWGGNVKVILALVAALPFAIAHAANDGELWESSVQMNIPGMPAGMGARKQQVCTEKGDAKKAAQKGNEKCKVTDLKESGNKTTMTMQCPEGTAVMEWNYNAAHTEYTGSMKMKTKDGDMNMTMAGKKLGACDLQAAQTARDQQTAQVQKQAAEAQASVAAMNKQMEMNRQKAFAALKDGCATGVTNMDYQKFQVALCEGKDAAGGNHCMSQRMKDEKARQAFQQYELPAQDKAFCEAKKKEFCGNLQTEAGFLKAAKTENVNTTDDEGKRKRISAGDRVPASSAYCGIKPASITTGLCSKAVAGESWGLLNDSNCPAEAKASSAKLCPRALETEHYGYVGAYCPVDAKAQYTKYCAGRDYTSMYQKKDKKMFQMCMALGTSVEEDRSRAHSIPTSTTQAVDAAKQGVNQGINKLKGLFGK